MNDDEEEEEEEEVLLLQPSLSPKTSINPSNHLRTPPTLTETHVGGESRPLSQKIRLAASPDVEEEEEERTNASSCEHRPFSESAISNEHHTAVKHSSSSLFSALETNINNHV